MALTTLPDHVPCTWQAAVTPDSLPDIRAPSELGQMPSPGCSPPSSLVFSPPRQPTIPAPRAPCYHRPAPWLPSRTPSSLRLASEVTPSGSCASPRFGSERPGLTLTVGGEGVRCGGACGGRGLSGRHGEGMGRRERRPDLSLPRLVSTSPSPCSARRPDEQWSGVWGPGQQGGGLSRFPLNPGLHTRCVQPPCLGGVAVAPGLRGYEGH